MNRTNQPTQALAPILRNPQIRLMLVIAPVTTTVVAVLSATESSLVISIILNAAAGLLFTATIVFLVGTVARGISDQRVAIAQAAEQGVWRARVQRLSIYNDETGLYNEWYFRLRFQEELERSRRHEQRCGLVLIESSALSCDAVRQEQEGWFGETIRSHLRKTDVAALLQDGQVAVLLPNVGRRAAQNLSRRLLEHLGFAEHQIGQASFPDDGQDLTALLNAAGVREKWLAA